MAGPGFLYPSIRLAHILQQNSHQVLFVSTHAHSTILGNYGIEHFPVGSTGRLFLDLHRWGYPEYALQDIRTVHEVINKFRPDVIVTSPLAIMSFILAEKHQIPVINIGFCEYLFPGKGGNNHDKQWRIDKFTEAYNSCRNVINMPSIENSPLDSPLLGTMYLLRSVPKLNDDILLPDKVVCIGDLYFEPSYVNIPMKQFIAESKAANRKIAYIQMGRLFRDHGIWSNLIHVLKQLPMNFIVDVGKADYSTADIKTYPNFFTSQFIPIGAVKNDIDYVICTGQTTSVISAIIHGKQILAIPHSTDSIELTKRLESKKLAFGIYGSENININIVTKLFEAFDNNRLSDTVTEYRNLFLSYTDDHIYEIIKPI